MFALFNVGGTAVQYIIMHDKYNIHACWVTKSQVTHCYLTGTRPQVLK